MKKIIEFLKKYLATIVSIVTMLIIAITSCITCSSKLKASADYFAYPTSGYSDNLPNYTDKLYLTAEQQTSQYGYILDTYFTLMGQSNECNLALAFDTDVFKATLIHNDIEYENYYLYTFYLSSPNINAPIEIRIGYGTASDFGTSLWNVDDPNYYGFGYCVYYSMIPPNVYRIDQPTSKYYTLVENYSGEIGLRVDSYDVTTTRTTGGPSNNIFNTNSIYRYLDEEQLSIKNAFDVAYQQGYQQGYVDGKNDGYQQGYDDGITNNSAYHDGYQQGLLDADNSPLGTIFGVVDDCLDYEIFPNFTFKYMLLIALGLIGLRLVLKMFMGD